MQCTTYIWVSGGDERVKNAAKASATLGKDKDVDKALGLLCESMAASGTKLRNRSSNHQTVTSARLTLST